MREILFRGKTKDNGEWVEGFYSKAKDYLSEKEIHVIFPLDLTLYPHSEFSSYEEIIPETIGQYTGLTDKNGKKIFEGDVIKYKEVHKFDDVDDIPSLEPENIEEKIGVIKYENGKFAPIPELHYCDDYWYAYGYINFEVVGNIHDNPELLSD
jgi:uncharacterized phage protein (TIGR01671 family)